MKKTAFLLLLLSGYFAEAQQKLQHISSAQNIGNNSTFINAEGLNNNPGAIIIVEYDAATANANPHPVGVWYSKGTWAIFNQDKAAMPAGLTYNLTWKNADANAYVHKVVNGNTTLDHPSINNNPSASFYASQVWNPGGAGGVYNNASIHPGYNAQTGRWSLNNTNNTPIPDGASFNILITAKSAAGGIIPGNTNPKAIFQNQPGTNNMPAIQGELKLNALNTYSDQRLNSLLRGNNNEAILSYLKSLSVSQRIIIQQQTTEMVRAAVASSTDENADDRDNDGHVSASKGGDDCDDLNPRIHPASKEACTQDIVYTGTGGAKSIWMPSLVDEDCDPCTYTDMGINGLSVNGDKDGDGLGSCDCYNYYLQGPLKCNIDGLDSNQKKWVKTIVEEIVLPDNRKIVIAHGADCDDTNPAITQNSQKCISENKVAVCVKGKWEVKDCRKCIAQPNGTGLVTEW